mmetsp:Transcript_151818/g.264554  ORF Transcript_151818/g.264554 Transcript_151818/m.264554 type:complete len:201 (-) Transcript_151818:566-1168(-)
MLNMVSSLDVKSALILASPASTFETLLSSERFDTIVCVPMVLGPAAEPLTVARERRLIPLLFWLLWAPSARPLSPAGVRCLPSPAFFVPLSSVCFDACSPFLLSAPAAEGLASLFAVRGLPSLLTGGCTLGVVALSLGPSLSGLPTLPVCPLVSSSSILSILSSTRNCRLHKSMTANLMKTIICCELTALASTTADRHSL